MLRRLSAHSTRSLAPLRSRSQVDEELKREIDDGEGEAKGLETTVEANEGALAADEKVGKADEDDAAKEDTQQIDGRRECVAAEASVVDLPAAWFSGNPGLVAQAGGEATCKEKSTDDDDDDETETLFAELATAMCVQMGLCVCVCVCACVCLCVGTVVVSEYSSPIPGAIFSPYPSSHFLPHYRMSGW